MTSQPQPRLKPAVWIIGGSVLLVSALSLWYLPTLLWWFVPSVEFSLPEAKPQETVVDDLPETFKAQPDRYGVPAKPQAVTAPPPEPTTPAVASLAPLPQIFQSQTPPQGPPQGQAPMLPALPASMPPAPTPPTIMPQFQAQGQQPVRTPAAQEKKRREPAGLLQLAVIDAQRKREPTREDQRQSAAAELIKSAVWATPAQPCLTLYRQQSIPGVTMDTMVSSIPGQYRIRVTVPVFDRFERRCELIPKDSVIIVKQDERTLSFGENRLKLSVEEIEPPTPEVISLKAAVGGSQGEAGLGGSKYVDNHIPQIILATLISAAINVGGRSLAGNPQGYQYSVGQEVTRDVGQSVSQDARSIVDRTLRIPPTVTIPEGTNVSISLLENVQFSKRPKVVR